MTYGGVAISPDRELIAYWSPDDSFYIRSKTIQMEIPRSSSFRSIAGWLDSNTLVISRRLGEEVLDDLVLLDFETGIEHGIPNNFREQWSIFPYPDWGSYSLSLFVPNSTLDRVVYPSLPLADRESGAIVLWDTSSEQIVIHLPGVASYGNGPVWTMDGRKFVINNTLRQISSLHGPRNGWDQELFIVEKDGTVTQTTSLLNYYAETEIGRYSWADDEMKIAFWLRAGEGTYPEPYPDPMGYTQQRIALVELATKQTTNFCIPGDEYSGLSPTPVWSPNGDYLLIENRWAEEESRLVLIDLVNESAMVIAENMTAIGWLND